MANTGDHPNPAATEKEDFSPEPDRSPPVKSGVAGRIILGLLLWFSFVRLPAATGPDQWPESWEPVLSFAFAHHLQWGRDIIFTYGPLGFLTTVHYWGNYFWFILFWAFGFALFLTVLLIGPLERLDPAWRILLCTALPWLTVPRNFDLGLDPVYLFAITVIGLALLSNRWRNPAWLVLLTSALSWLSLIKFTFCLDAIFVLLIVVFAQAGRRDWKTVSIIIGSLISSFLLIWRLAGQEVSNLGSWFKYSFQIASGYSSAMAMVPSEFEFVLGIVAGLCLLGLLLILWRGSADRWTQVPPAGIILIGIFLAWKEGFVRADFHVAVFFAFAFLMALALPGLFSSSRKRPPFLFPLIMTTLALVVFTYALHTGTLVMAAKTGMASRLTDLATAVFAPGQFKRELEVSLEAMRHETRLPKIAAIVGTATVGMLNNDQDVAILNQFSYQPQPVFQNYAAYKPALQQLNASFYDSTNAPKFVLWRFGTLDAHFPTLNDGRIFLILLADYSPVISEGKYVLWQRNPRPKPMTLAGLKTTTDALGHWIPISADANWLQVALHETWFGIIRRLLYQGSMPVIEVRLADGRTRQYNLPAGFAASGFVLNPLLDSSTCLGIPFLPQNKPVQVIAVRILADKWCYADSVQLNLQQVNGIPALQLTSGPP